MATLNLFQKIRLSVHQAVLKMYISVRQCSANFQPSLDCFIPNFEYEDSENIKADRVSTVFFSLHQIKRRTFLLDTWYTVVPAKYRYETPFLKTGLPSQHKFQSDIPTSWSG